MKTIATCAVMLAVLLLNACRTDKKDAVVFKFDSNKEVSGKKIAIKDVVPDLPLDWDDYDYVSIEFRSTTPQRFHLGFTTDEGYNELRLVSYVPKAWNKLVIPLRFFREAPAAMHDIASTSNQPRVTGWINLGGKRGALRGVDSIGIRMRAPVNNPEIELRGITLHKEDPGDEYLEKIPAIDKFGQWKLGDFEGKIYSEEQLRKEWDAEDAAINEVEDFNYSLYGGYLNKKVKSTGFFRTEFINGRWWFVDPEGYLFLSFGINGIRPGGDLYTKNIDKCGNMFQELAPRELFIESANVSPETHSASFGVWNLYRRYGENYIQESAKMAVRRMTGWGINTIANWSSPHVYSLNRKAFILPLRGLGTTNSLMGLADVYAGDFHDKLDKAVEENIAGYKDNPFLLGYFVGNEPAWLTKEERLSKLILEGEDCPVKTEFLKYLKKGDTPKRRKEFIYKTFEIFMKSVSKSLKKHDPNHLNLGIRYGYIEQLNDELLRMSKETFDVLSFNCYALAPDHAKMDYAMKISGLPMFIGEYHFGTVDRGLAQSLWQVNSQKERGGAFRYYTENGFAHPGLIGASWFIWCDQNINGRSDGENYNCGFVDVTDRPYPHMAAAAKETAKRLYYIHAGEKEPVNVYPKAVGHSPVPDIWE
ncbi:MAG: hypothetical protein LBS07_03605 [Prevotellaceae bacterium]|jgi:hypothetical protein|nr:hypothetical protein [Prevotellaceae bacterium]